MSLAASRTAASFGEHLFGVDAGRQRGPERLVDVVSLAIAQPAELEHGCTVADLLNQRTLQVVPELGMADQDDGELAASFRHQLDQALERGQRLGMQIVRVVEESIVTFAARAIVEQFGDFSSNEVVAFARNLP